MWYKFCFTITDVEMGLGVITHNYSVYLAINSVFLACTTASSSFYAFTAEVGLIEFDLDLAIYSRSGHKVEASQ